MAAVGVVGLGGLSAWFALGGTASAAGPAPVAVVVPAGTDDNPVLDLGEQTPEQVARQNALMNDPEVVAAGRQLFLTGGCASCHGLDARGLDYPSGLVGPNLVGVGAAAADFMLRTGRMPMADDAIQAPAKPVAFSEEEIEALVAYVASLGPGPEIPALFPDMDLLAEGGVLFRDNCAACHTTSAVGGALSYGQHAPDLRIVPPVQIAEAMRIGPGTMPVFGPETLSDRQVDAIVTYIRYLSTQDVAPGGLPIGWEGPVSEGVVAWLIGLGALVLAVRWIARKRVRTDEVLREGGEAISVGPRPEQPEAPTPAPTDPEAPRHP